MIAKAQGFQDIVKLLTEAGAKEQLLCQSFPSCAQRKQIEFAEGSPEIGVVARFELPAPVVVSNRGNLCDHLFTGISTKIIQTGHRHLLN